MKQLRTGVQLAGYPKDSKEMPPLVFSLFPTRKSHFRAVFTQIENINVFLFGAGVLLVRVSSWMSEIADTFMSL